MIAMQKRILLSLFVAFIGQLSLLSQTEPYTGHLKFKQLEEELPTPNSYRTASGAPGPNYYQQKADYEISVRLDDDRQTLSGTEVITYTNNAPEALEYLWVQLDQNMRDPEGLTAQKSTGKLPNKDQTWRLGRLFPDFPGGYRIEAVEDLKGKSLKTAVNYTMMRIDLDEPLKTGESFEFRIKWWYPINDRMRIGGRSGYEYFSEDKNYLYTIAQFFPRMAVYNDVYGWQNKQFLGSGEFTLPFGDYKVSIDVPADHIVAATGKLSNEKDVLTSDERRRLNEARTNENEPVIIVTQEEAEEKEMIKSSARRTWVFEAENVRDFAFASSRKFIWDAMAVDINGKKVMAMSYYPKEGNPLWERYSTRVVAQTLKTYSKFTIDYPYHKAISVHANRIGMEYPMICFNGGRPRSDGTYSQSTKHGMISVIIHEVGHNFFPMIINSDERQWTWMDEGLNTFVQYLTEQEWDRHYPSRRGPAENIVDYMDGNKQRMVPIMTNSESIIQFGNNAYGKPATALNILRETVMGRELFDKAFKYYSERWAFKHPTPADFFRTMEDASAVDLDWFWRGWFYTVDHVDFELANVTVYDTLGGTPLSIYPDAWSAVDSGDTRDISAQRNDKAIPETWVERDAVARDEYTGPIGVQSYPAVKSPARMDDDSPWYYLEAEIQNKGGLIMPLILRFHFEGGSSELVRLPAEVWLKNEAGFTKSFRFKHRPIAVELDPFKELADINMDDNSWPPKDSSSEFDIFLRDQMEGNSTEGQ
jgi:hypothetical protein